MRIQKYKDKELKCDLCRQSTNNIETSFIYCNGKLNICDQCIGLLENIDMNKFLKIVDIMDKEKLKLCELEEDKDNDSWNGASKK